MSIVERSLASGAPPERSLSLVGAIIKARYRLNAVAAVSRDAVVYAAEELRYGRPVAVKVLRDEVAGDPEFVAAARVQATTLAMSVHARRGVPRVYECGLMDSGELFIALEPLRGVTLREVLDARGPLSAAAALRLASQVGEALEMLHHDRIVHGALGPESILLVKEGDGSEHVTLVGVELTAAYRTPLGRRRREASPPPYAAPEQRERGETTEATDQFALGMLLRELLGPATPLPPETERILATALEPRPERRFADISVMVNDLWAAQTALAEPAPPPPPAPRPAKARTAAPRRHPRASPRVPLRIAAAVATAGLLAALAWFALSGGLGARVRALVPARAVTAAPAVDAPGEPPARADDVAAAPAAAPRSAPVPERTPPAPAERDGSGAIDWVLKRRR
jgi:serine/threonine-protein kinase